ncbi:MAG TPA: NAD-dependent epimerase/dehydratase family protein [Acetobacteraceae bacterium]|nr:NAD-dependent epimerase/dehydratase family protein [Acetobacteraceae bacterium]
MGLYTITGGAGFIGSHLADSLLAAGHQVRVFDDFSTGRMENVDPRCKVIRSDILDAAALRRALDGADGCFHLAAIASVARANEAWLDTHRVNQLGSVAVFEAAVRAGGTPVVYASSAAVYGDLSGRVAREDMAPRPQTAYGADKLGTEVHGRIGWGVHGLPNLGLRLFNVYGPRQDPLSPYSGVISIFAQLVGIGAPLTMNDDGLQVRDFIYVHDVVTHFRAAMQRLKDAPGCDVLNVCTGRATTIMDLALILGEIHGRVPRINHGPARPGDIRQSVGDPARAVTTLGVSARTALVDGLSVTLASLQSQAA